MLIVHGVHSNCVQFEETWTSSQLPVVQGTINNRWVFFTSSHTIHVWYIYHYLPTWMVWGWLTAVSLAGGKRIFFGCRLKVTPSANSCQLLVHVNKPTKETVYTYPWSRAPSIVLQRPSRVILHHACSYHMIYNLDTLSYSSILYDSEIFINFHFSTCHGGDDKRHGSGSTRGSRRRTFFASWSIRNLGGSLRNSEVPPNTTRRDQKSLHCCLQSSDICWLKSPYHHQWFASKEVIPGNNQMVLSNLMEGRRKQPNSNLCKSLDVRTWSPMISIWSASSRGNNDHQNGYPF